jgi:hypothetical protein
MIVSQKTTHPNNCRTLVEFRFPAVVTPITIAAMGSHIAGARKFPLDRISEWKLFAFVEMFITTSTAELPGVTGVDGLKMH